MFLTTMLIAFGIFCLSFFLCRNIRVTLESCIIIILALVFESLAIAHMLMVMWERWAV